MWKSLLLLTLLMGFPLVASAQGAHYDNSPDDLTGGGTITGTVRLDCTTNPCQLIQTAPTSDVAPRSILEHAADAYPGAAGANLVGGTLWLRGGIGARIITVTNRAISVGDTIVFDVSTTTTALTSTTLTAGTSFVCAAAASEAACATNLAAAADALAGMSATAVGAVVYVVPDANAMAVTIGAPADGGVDGVFATRTSSADGQVLLGNGTSAAPAWGFASDPDNGAAWAATNYWCLYAGGAAVMCLSGTAVNITQNVNLLGKGLYDSSRSAIIGATACVTGHSLATGDTCNNGKLEANGQIFADAGLAVVGIEADLTAGACTPGDYKVDTGNTRENCRCHSAGDAYDCCTVANPSVCSTNGPVD